MASLLDAISENCLFAATAASARLYFSISSSGIEQERRRIMLDTFQHRLSRESTQQFECDWWMANPARFVLSIHLSTFSPHTESIFSTCLLLPRSCQIIPWDIIVAFQSRRRNEKKKMCQRPLLDAVFRSIVMLHEKNNALGARLRFSL